MSQQEKHLKKKHKSITYVKEATAQTTNNYDDTIQQPDYNSSHTNIFTKLLFKLRETEGIAEKTMATIIDEYTSILCDCHEEMRTKLDATDLSVETKNKICLTEIPPKSTHKFQYCI